MVSAIPTFVVDDEPLARKRVMRLLRADPEINLVGTFDSATEAATHARELAPQLLLLDIRMPESSTVSSWWSRSPDRVSIPTSSS